MESQWKLLVYLFGTILTILEGSHALKLQLYQKANYVGFQGEFNLNGADEAKCVTIKDGGYGVESVKTDKCIILYQMTDCVTPKAFPTGILENKEFSHRFDKDTPVFKTDTTPKYPFQSFHVCSQARGGGPQLDLDIYSDAFYPNELVEEYRGVCGCRNVPLRASQNHKIYVDVHGNTIQMFSGENCQGSSRQLGPHDDIDNHFLYKTIGFEAKSFKPVGLNNCYKLHAEIYKFHFKNGTNDINSLPTTNIKLGVNSVIENNGTSEDSQTYTFSSTITETVEYTLTESITEMHSAGTSVGVEATAEVGVPLVASAEVTTKIEANYQWSKEHGSESSKTTSITTEESIEIAQEMKIPGCNKCTISSAVKKIKDFPILYDLFVIVRAPDGDPDLAAADIKQNLPAGMEYIKDHDKYSVEAKTNGKMLVEFGLEILSSKHCEPVSGCGPPGYVPPPASQAEYSNPVNRVK